MIRHILLLCMLWPIAYSMPSNWHSLQSSQSPFHNEQIKHSEPITHLTINLHNIDSQQASTLSQAVIDSSTTKLIPIANQRQIWCIGTASSCHAARDFIRRLDQPTPMIKIQAKIVSIDKQQVQSLGIDFKTLTTDNQGLHQNLPTVSTLNGSALVTLVRTGDSHVLAMEIAALEKRGLAKIIARPTLITSNDHAAVVESGEEVPYQQNTSSGATNIAFKKAVLRLSVTPHLINKQTIRCQIDIHHDKVTPINVNGVPIIHTQHIQTKANVHNQRTLVLGGIVTDSLEQSLQSVPGISRIPLLGKLFQHKQLQHKQSELFIFVTPSLS